jgi:hypothetical protein
MIYTGTIMEIKNSKAYVFTETCEFLPIRAKKEYLLGQQVHFADRDVCLTNNILRLNGFKVLAAAALIVLIAAAVLAAFLSPRGAGGFDTACVAVVSFDLNPSIEMSVNKDYRVIDVVYSNQDGSSLTEGLDLKTKTVPEALRQILDRAEQKGYLDSKKIVLITGAPNTAEADKTYGEQLKGILSSLAETNGTEIITAYVDDARIISDAKSSDVSIGKMLLFRYASDNGYNITLQEVKDGSVSDILDQLNVSGDVVLEQQTAPSPSPSQEASPSLETSPSPSPEQMPSPSPSVEPSPSPSAAPSPALSPSPEQSPSPTPLPAGFAAKLTASASNGRLRFSWTPVPGEEMTYNGKSYSDFSYYKIVASADDQTPVYPDNGYINVISEAQTSSWTVDPAAGKYNQSPTLEAGQKYYFAITYVFGNGKFTSNVIRLTVPDYIPEDTGATAFAGPQLNVSADGNRLHFSWTPLPDRSVTFNGKTYSDFSYYKVVASETDKTPVYPDNGYLCYISDTGSSAWDVDPSAGDYNMSPKLEAGKTYYFAITYVFSNGKFVSNTATATVPAYAEQPAAEFAAPTLLVSASGRKLTFAWTPLPDSSVTYNGTAYENFNYYKVVASETNPFPVYPDDGYLSYLSDLGASRWTVDPAAGDYNQSPVLEPGKTYYFSITYVFSTGKFTSNTVQLTIPVS